MNLAIMKTKAELALVEAFQNVAGQLPGGAGVLNARREAAERFEALGLPHRRMEEWKYTDLRQALKDALPPRIADKTALKEADVTVALGPLGEVDAHRVVFVNGTYRPELSTKGVLDGLDFTPLASVLANGAAHDGSGLLETSGPADDATLALNTAFMSDGTVLSVREGAELSKPLIIAHVRAGDVAHASTVRHVISIGARARATIVEAFVSLPGAAESQINTATEVVVGDKAWVTHVKCAADCGAVTHLSNWMVRMGEESEYRGFQQTQGVALARNQIFVAFDGEDAKLDFSGAFLGRGSDHIDTAMLVDHAVPGCESREWFKGVLDGQAHGVFQGKILVQQIAQKTDGKLMAQGLMLSPDAEFDSKPELEIFADDVACGHGSTVAELDEDLMFYCQSRGIPELEARALLMEAFIAEVIEKVEDAPVREALSTLANRWLRES